MDTVKVVIMAGPWTEWKEQLESVSPRAVAVAAHSDGALLREIADAEVVFGRLPRALLSQSQEDFDGCRVSASALKPCSIPR